MKQTILVTGGTGYIGSHTCVELLENGYDVVIADNLSNSKRQVVDRIQEVAGKAVTFYEVDVADEQALARVFAAHAIDAVIHFAGLKAVGESVEKPLAYYQNNLNATMSLLVVMSRFGVNKIAFSSSATVYIDPAPPIREDAPLGCTNPYGWTKFMSEIIITDWQKTNGDNAAVLLRYFNPIGAHESGKMGEDPQGIPNNLFPYITRVAGGAYPHLNIFGADYDTPDGTGVRDYIHVVDLARGHVLALKYLDAHNGALPVNLGTGLGYSVFDVLRAYERASGKEIPFVIQPRRAGDVASTYADPTLARELLGWTAEKTLDDMCLSGCRWQSLNPNGYED
ncbi:MAG: UDP-glucose 4-epimerase GalE [Clostridiales bacterium]|nr:UDP-glucose 4-epimerase GalE [Clostridiales bacterium]